MYKFVFRLLGIGKGLMKHRAFVAAAGFNWFWGRQLEGLPG